MSLPQHHTDPSAQTRLALIMAAAGVFLLVAAGGLLWWREGDKLFTDGLVTALMRCF